MYIARTLSFDRDALNAFSGILARLSGNLGKFHWGLPLRLFARALLYSLPINQIYGMRTKPDPLMRRPDFPSWSWLGWKNQDNPRLIYESPHELLYVLVHFYSCDECGKFSLLRDPCDDPFGLEIDDAHVMANYNKVVREHLVTNLGSLKDLPLYPGDLEIPQLSHHEVVVAPHMLGFWTHVGFDNGIELALIGATPNQYGYHEYVFHCIRIERYKGYVRRTGAMLSLSWLEWIRMYTLLEFVILI